MSECSNCDLTIDTGTWWKDWWRLKKWRPSGKPVIYCDQCVCHVFPLSQFLLFIHYKHTCYSTNNRITCFFLCVFLIIYLCILTILDKIIGLVIINPCFHSYFYLHEKNCDHTISIKTGILNWQDTTTGKVAMNKRGVAEFRKNILKNSFI